MKIEIRCAKKTDLASIYKMGMDTKELWVSKNTKFYTKKELSDWFQNPRENLLLVATAYKKIIGFSFSKIMSSEWAMGDTMAIDSKFRNLGIGSLLFKKRVKILKKLGINFLSSIVKANSKKSRDFWKKKGFKEGERLIWMEKNI